MNPLPADLRSEHRTEPVTPKPLRLVEMSMPRSASRSSTFRRDSGYLTYIITTRRITSGELSKYRNGFVDSAMPETLGAPAVICNQFGPTVPTAPVEGMAMRWLPGAYRSRAVCWCNATGRCLRQCAGCDRAARASPASAGHRHHTDRHRRRQRDQRTPCSRHRREPCGILFARPYGARRSPWQDRPRGRLQSGLRRSWTVDPARRRWPGQSGPPFIQSRSRS